MCFVITYIAYLANCIIKESWFSSNLFAQFQM